MKFTVATILLSLASISALQAPIQKAVAAASVASVLVAGPLAAPALVVQPVPTAVVLNIKAADIDPIATAKNLFAHRSQLSDAAKDFITSTQKLTKDLDGLLPQPEVGVTAPSDVKEAVRDALAGQARLVVNGEPVYFEVESQEGFFTFKILSPILPQLPFLTPTDEQRASMVIPRAKTVYITKPEAPAATAVTTTDSKAIWEWCFHVPVLDKDVTLLEAAEVAAGVVVGAYVTTFGYYSISRALDDKQAEEKKQANLAKAAAAKKAKAKAASDTA